MGTNKDVNPRLVRTMFNSIRSEEIKNIKTQKRDDKGMVKIIEDYVIRKIKDDTEYHLDGVVGF